MPSRPALAPGFSPPFPTVTAPAGWSAIDLLSDLHLSPLTPRTADRLARYLEASTADAVVLLGDIFEVWVGDDARFEGFERDWLDTLRRASAVRPIHFMPGNRDFLLGADFLADAGLQAWHDPTVLQAFGTRYLLTHGDALCLSDTDYQAFRRQVRDPAWASAFLARPLAERREQARRMREASQAHQRDGDYASEIDLPAARACLQAAGSRVLIHGHTHRPSQDDLGEGHTRWVLSDWCHDGGTVRGDVLRLTSQGVERLPMA